MRSMITRRISVSSYEACLRTTPGFFSMPVTAARNGFRWPSAVLIRVIPSRICSYSSSEPPEVAAKRALNPMAVCVSARHVARRQVARVGGPRVRRRRTACLCSVADQKHPSNGGRRLHRPIFSRPREILRQLLRAVRSRYVYQTERPVPSTHPWCTSQAAISDLASDGLHKTNRTCASFCN